ncbi:12-oxophytodienoate reductase 11 [Micractinium conductrix]|uniref:12-oxophytodienoate reductase 11 n=1 Tax=Micractinium conductrix TaxID=554055 RepID=A0A2P6V9U6_9CHLO|nr:12-oxophytodienoate reductase 11 [Micractinium conductrix]|eukprot:PSC70848.1 12-oxophytodienoate reductase 11 [Micractinium conductrix]
MSGSNGSDGSGPAAALFRPYELPGGVQLQHRMVYAPLTRCRAFGNIPQPSAATYYSQRATPGGLMISEGTIVSETGFGYPCTPGIFTQEQIDGWKPVVQAVKDKGATFFCQIWHVGRASHPHYQPNEELPISSTTKPVSGQCFSLKSMQMEDHLPSRALAAEELPAIVEQFAAAARNLVAAGFNGVEIHGANGYLIDQFLKDGINDRTDAYGGPIENRCRFCLEVVKAVCDAIGSEKVGIRLSPFGGFLDGSDSHPYALTTYLLEELNKHNLAYVHLVEPRVAGNTDLEYTLHSIAPFRSMYKGTLIAAVGYTAENGAAAVESGHCDLVCYGRWWISNPDLPRRFRLGAPLTKYDRATFYTQAAEGYTDYPFLEDSEEGKAFLAKLPAN